MMSQGESTTSRQPSLRDDAIAIIRRLRDSGHIAYLAGGCVRDMLLGIQSKDFDVATDAPPDRVRTLFINTQAVGAKFGVILVRQGKSVIEVATFRTDIDYQDGRHPREVKFTTAEEDAQRRDFTINGLFLDPMTDQVIDYVGGQADLQNRILRAIGQPNHRFEEDHLRMLRAVRFASRFNLEIESATAAAIELHAEQLKRISPERIADELRLMLIAPTRIHAWRLFRQLGLIQVIFRSLPEQIGQRAPDHSGNELFPQIAPGESVSFPLALAGMILCYRTSAGQQEIKSLVTYAEAQRAVRACRTTLKISNDESDSLRNILNLARLLEENPPTVATMKRFLAMTDSADAVRLLEAMLRSNIGLPRIQWLLDEFQNLRKTDVAPPPLLTGDDLVARGQQPGKLFKRVLDAVYDAQLEGRVSDKEQAMALALAIAGQPDAGH